MNIFQARLTRLETRLQTLIEDSAARLFPGRESPHQLTRHLLRAMQAAARPTREGSFQVPNLYHLCLHPGYAEALRETPAFMAELTGLLHLAIQEAGWSLSGPLQVHIEPDPRLAPGEVQVLAHDSLENLSPTHGLRLPHEPNGDTPPSGAFLIVNGVAVFPLEQTVVNIGRRPDNQLVIDDARISRLHAQLRLVRGCYVLFDLGSTGGSFVNGRRIHQHILHAGDVISLAGLPLVYGHDNDTGSDTQKMRFE